jgi:hypothetical protein
MFSEYKNIFGEVGKGVHSYRIFNIAIVDVFLTVLLAYIIYYFSNSYSFLFILLLVFISGIILHRLFGVKTTINKLL